MCMNGTAVCTQLRGSGNIPLEQLFVIMILNLEGAFCSFCFGNIQKSDVCKISRTGNWTRSPARSE